MAIILPPGFGAVDMTLRHNELQRDAHITFGIEVNTAVEGSAVAVRNAYDTAVNGRMDSNVTQREVRVEVGQDGGDPIIDIATSSVPGGRSGASTTAALAVLVNKRTGLGGRRNAGRNFWPWMIADTEVSETGIITPAVVVSLQSIFTNFLTALDANDVPMVLLHRSGGITPAGDPTPVTAMVVDNVISTQRRRQPRNV